MSLAPAHSDIAAVADAGIRCPGCGYNLTGLTEPRCSECGRVFDWDELRRRAAAGPTIAFERMRGWRKLPGFALTWLTVIFAPWVFARQIAARVSTRHGLAFGAVCFASTAIPFSIGMDLPFWGAWVITAAIYIAVQAVGLALLDPSTYRKPIESLRFWLLVGCYTSAVMLTEFAFGPPVLTNSDIFERGPNLHWIQLAVGCIPVAWCYGVRLRSRGVSRSLAVIASLIILVLLHLQFLFAVGNVGFRLFDAFGGKIRYV